MFIFGMPGLVPGILVFVAAKYQDVDGREEAMTISN
jgi:hypothetical protein